MKLPRRGRHRSTTPAAGWEIALAELLARALGAGLDLDPALAVAATGTPLAAPLEVARGLGVPAGAALARCAIDRPTLGDLARALALAERSGAPAAAAVRSVAAAARERQEQQRVLTTAAAGAKATVRLLVGLPLAGPLLVAAAGVPVTEVYGAALAPWCLALGVLLAGAGLLWCRRMLGRALRPTPVSSARLPATPALTVPEVAATLDLLALTLRGPTGLLDCLDAVAQVPDQPAAGELAVVAAGLRWGESAPAAWGRLDPLWQPVAAAWAAAGASGLALADLVEAAASGVRTVEGHRARQAVAEAATQVVLPLGLCFLPAFVATTVVPLVLFLAGGFLRAT